MGKRYLFDTNTVIDYIGDRLPINAALVLDKTVDEELNKSIIVKIEALGFNGEASEMKKT